MEENHCCACSHRDTLRHSDPSIYKEGAVCKAGRASGGVCRTAGDRRDHPAHHQHRRQYRALRTAELTLQKGQREKQNADLKYSAGLLDREAYLKEEQTWLERTASLDAARLALAEAMDDYDWAVLGFVSLR